MLGKKGKYIYGVVKMGDKGQIVIPKEARDMFHLEPGDGLLVMGDEKQGLALVKCDVFEAFADQIFGKKEEE